MTLHLNILDDQRRALLPLLKEFSSDGFYLAGGTGLALQLGHRDSIDFDFFKEGDFDTAILAEKIITTFSGHSVTITQQERNTISCLIDNAVSLSFFGFRYELLEPLIESDYFTIASMVDIGCMKCAAITSRWVEKDYVDLYFILQRTSLENLINGCAKKYPSLDTALILKSMVYFDDVTEEPILFKEGHDVSFLEIQNFLMKNVSIYASLYKKAS